MKLRDKSPWLMIERVVPWLVLAILLTYSYAKFFRHSYGFRVDPSTALIMSVFDRQPEPTLRENDRIVRVGSMPWEGFLADLRRPLFQGYQPGDQVPLTVERNGQEIDILWKYPSFSRGEFFDQLNSEWWFAYFFWLAGVLTVLLVRPKDESWLLMSLFNFMTAIWLIAGSGLSAYHIWYSALVLRVTIWLCLPVYLHLHWVFPRPLGKLPSWLVSSVYGVAILFAIAQAFQAVPGELYILGFLVAVGGSLILLLVHVWRQPAVRRDFRLPLIVLILAVAPALLWSVIDSVVSLPPHYGSAPVLSLTLLPLAYLYTAFRRRLGNLELRVNRFFTAYLFVILLAVSGVPLIAVLDQAPEFSGKAFTVSFISMVFTTAAFLWVYSPFEKFMDRRIFGISVPSRRLLETYSTNITTSLSVSELIRVLQEDILPSLLIRQFAFLRYDRGSLTMLSSRGLKDQQVPNETDLSYLIDRSGPDTSPDLVSGNQPYPWIRLILPLRLGDQIIGFWLFGRRDPDDLYPQQEIPTLSSLANLTAIALSNLLQTERLTSMYQTNINRYEEERVSLARDLHDVILNELAALPIRRDAPVFSSTFQRAYDGVSERLREIVHHLRPPMLMFGLKLALEAYAETLRDRNPASVEIRADIQTDGECRYALVVESNLYRIVQEACENSLRYAQAKHLAISGRLAEHQIQLRVSDDGAGLDPGTSLSFNDLLIHKHFGLAGMHERASVIGAEVDIHSRPNAGTQIELSWKPRELD